MIVVTTVLFTVCASVATYQQTFGNDRESVPFWMGFAIINAIFLQGF